MIKKKVFFQEVRGGKYEEGFIEMEEHPISDLEKEGK